MMWQRPEVFKVWAACAQQLVDSFPDIEIEVMVAGSEGKVSRELVASFAFHYIEVRNQPIGRKANRRLMACKKLKPDYVLFLGSDDVVSPKTFEYMLGLMGQGIDEIVNMDLYYYDAVSKKAVHSIGYVNQRQGEPMAVGRVVSKRVLDGVDWRLWSDHIFRGLDGVSRDRLKSAPHDRHEYRLKDEGLMIIDIKTPANITKFVMRPNYTEIPFYEIQQQFPNYKLIQNL